MNLNRMGLYLQYETESIDYGINRTSAETNSNYNPIHFIHSWQDIIDDGLNLVVKSIS